MHIINCINNIVDWKCCYYVHRVKKINNALQTVKPLYCVRIVTSKLLGNPESMGCGPTPPIGLDHILNRIRCLLACCGGKIIVKQSDMYDGKGEQHKEEKSNVRRLCRFRKKAT